MVSDFRSSIRPSNVPPQRAARDPATDIYRLLDNYAADITKAGESTCRWCMQSGLNACQPVASGSFRGRAWHTIRSSVRLQTSQMDLPGSDIIVHVAEAEIESLARQREAVDEACPLNNCCLSAHRTAAAMIRGWVSALHA